MNVKPDIVIPSGYSNQDFEKSLYSVEKFITKSFLFEKCNLLNKVSFQQCIVSVFCVSQIVCFKKCQRSCSLILHVTVTNSVRGSVDKQCPILE